MSDEQPIYISPEDDLTTVRERLERIPNRHVVLVIPAQTQLRSHVAWKLLYARARELSKEVLIVSSDPQVRSVAHAVKFKVAHSLESSQPGKSRPSTRPVNRTPTRGRPASSSRSLATKASGEPRNAASPRSGQLDRTLDRSAFQPGSPGTQPRDDDDDTITNGLKNPISSTFDAPEKQYGQPYDYRIDTSPPIHPLSPQAIEDPDFLFEDYTRAQDILKAAQEGSKPPTVEKPESMPPATPGDRQRDEGALRSFKITPLPKAVDDPFFYMGDSQPPPGSEQRGAVSLFGQDLEDYDTNEPVIQDVPDLPTSILNNDIEYQEDRGDFVPPASRSGTKQTPEEPPEAGSSYVHGVRPRRSRSGYMASPPQRPDLEEDALPPVEERPTRLTPQTRIPPAAQVPTTIDLPRNTNRPAQPSSAPAARARPTPALSSPAPRSSPLQRPPAQRPPSGSLQRSQAAQRSPSGRTSAGGATRGSTGAARKQPARQVSRVPIATVVIICLLLVVVGLLAFLVPSADVRITLYSRSYSHSLSMVAHTENAAGALTAVKLAKDFIKTGTGQASGSKMVGTASAKGTVFFTNNGQNPVEIPTGSTVATSGVNSVQFATTANVVVSPGNAASNAIPVPIQAVKPGSTGNVQAGTITVIPDDSLSAIAQDPNNKITVSNLKLAVTNPDATTGGGVQPAPTVQQKDIDAAKNNLQQEAQSDIDTWVKGLSSSAATSKPITTDTQVNVPQVDQVESDKTFPVSLKVNATVLLVRMNDLQQAAISQLNDAIAKDKNYTGYAIVQDAKLPVKITQLSVPSSNATSMTIKFNATGSAAPVIRKEVIQGQIVGRDINDARSVLTQLQGVQNVTIQTSPSFVHWIPFWTQHINVIFIPGSVQPPQPSKKP